MFYRRNPDAGSAQPQEDPEIDFDVLGDLSDEPTSAAIVAEPASQPILPAPVEAAPDNHAEPIPMNPSDYKPTAHVGASAQAAAPPANLPEPTPFVPAQPNSTDLAPRSRPAESVIGPDDFFDGNYRSERGVRIQGTARGTIESRQYIYVEEGAHVEANLAAEDITISGTCTGVIECRRRLEITSSGTVQGRVQTALLSVQEGGIINGELHMERAP